MRCQLSRHSASPLLSCPPCSLPPWPSFTGNRLWHSTQVCQEAPTALRAKKKKKQGTDFILGHASSQVSSLLQYREVSPHTSRTGTPPRASLPCKPEATPAGTKESIGDALVSEFPSGAGLSRQRDGEERHHLFTAPSDINATRQEGAEDLSLCGEGRKRGNVNVPGATHHIWACTSTFAAITLGRRSNCSADHSGSRVQRCWKLKPAPVGLGSTPELTHGSLMLLSHVLILQQNVGQKIYKAGWWGKGSQITLLPGFSIKPPQIPFSGLYY